MKGDQQDRNASGPRCLWTQMPQDRGTCASIELTIERSLEFTPYSRDLTINSSLLVIQKICQQTYKMQILRIRADVDVWE